MYKTTSMDTNYSEKLAKFALTLLTIALVAVVCWYFKSVLICVIMAALVALLTRPLCNFICKPNKKGHSVPKWAGAAISLVVFFIVLLGLNATIIPLIRDISRDISTANVNDMARSVTVPLAEFNNWVISRFPKVGPDFKIERVALEALQGLFNVDNVSTVVGSVTAFVAKFGVGLFAIIFISFFFIKSPDLPTRMVLALVPDKNEEKTRKSMNEIDTLISRYFIGIVIEILGVAFVDFLGMLLIARMGFKYSLGIAFTVGVLNIIPYFGPLLGGVLGVSMSLIIKYACSTSFGLSVGFLPFVLILVAILVVTQWIDNYVFQPIIYSNSVNVHPLEIFIVFLMAGHIGGIIGMFAAIPVYTILRVIAKEFFGDVKVVKRLTSIGDGTKK